MESIAEVVDILRDEFSALGSDERSGMTQMFYYATD